MISRGMLFDIGYSNRITPVLSMPQQTLDLVLQSHSVGCELQPRWGAQAGTFASAAKLTSWVGTCPGKEESAEQNHSSRSAKGNKYMRRVLNHAAHVAAAKKGSHFQIVFRRLLPRLGYQSAIWAVAHRLLSSGLEDPA